MNESTPPIGKAISAVGGETFFPSVCVGMISYNDAHLLGAALESIFSQDYPVEKLEVLIVDGGSTDGTLEVIRRTRARVISRPDLKDDPMKRGEMATSLPKSEVVVFFSADNRFLENHALRELVAPLRDPEIAGAGSFRYGWRARDTALVRYFALIGGGDPIAIALGTADRAPFDVENWQLRGQAEDKGTYFKVAYEPDPRCIPTLGANGYAFRKNDLDAVGGAKNSLHMDAGVLLVRAGYKFASVKTCHVVHLLANDLGSFVRRKVHWAKLYSQPHVPKIYQVYDPQRDWWKAGLIALYFFTVILPLLRSLHGYCRFRDAAWFLHPLVGMVFVIHYGMMALAGRFPRKWPG